MSLNDYDLLNILDKNTNSKILKVRCKETGEHFVSYTIDCEHLNDQQLKCLEERFLIRKTLQHPNLLVFHDLIKDENSLLWYLVVKYCKHGSLKDVMDKTFNESKRFSEEFLCKILYQVAFAVKTLNFVTNIDIKDIYFDADYNIKFYNFNIHSNDVKLKTPKISCLGTMMFEVCTLTKFGKKYFVKELKSYNNLYSKDFISLLSAMIKDNRDLKKNTEKVMCNSTVLFKITQFNKCKCFLKIDDGNTASQMNENPEDIYASQLEKLKEKEIMLNKKENMLNEREHKIFNKEKKLALLEKQLTERLEQANLHLTKSCHCLSKTSPVIDQTESIKESLDSTYISCGDSVIKPTSKKLNLNEIIKPPVFARTISEKRIRFKGHSPLKEVDFNKRRSVRYTKTSKDIYGKNTEWITCSDDRDRSTVQRKKVSNKKCKQLFNTYENNANLTVGDQTKPLKWTEENKKYAFELLRIMNQDKENKPPDVKHTYL